MRASRFSRTRSHSLPDRASPYISLLFSSRRHTTNRQRSADFPRSRVSLFTLQVGISDSPKMGGCSTAMNPIGNLFNRSLTEPSFATDCSARHILWLMCYRTFAGNHPYYRTAPVGAPLDQVARSSYSLSFAHEASTKKNMIYLFSRNHVGVLQSGGKIPLTS